MQHNQSPETPLVDLTGQLTNHNPYNEHLQHCSQCRSSHNGQCEEGDRTLHEAVQNGSASSYDRELDRERNGHLED